MATRLDSVSAVLDGLRGTGATRGSLVALSLAPGVGLGVAVENHAFGLDAVDPVAAVRLLETELRPRWVWWSAETPAGLVRQELRVATCWDLAAVHRLIFGSWRADPALVWAALRGLASSSLPVMGQLDLLADHGDDGIDFEDPVRPDGHLRPEWIGGAWAENPERLAHWALVQRHACGHQLERLADLPAPGRALATARAESAAELLCTELAADGLPLDRAEAERIIASYVGPRPASEAEALLARQQRDETVLSTVAGRGDIDLRNPAHVKALLRREGIEVSDTRAWRLEELRADHPVVEALLTWRKAERVATTFGYAWLDEHVGADGRLRGAWTSSDGAAGRMTAQAGLHNLPAELRPAVVAGPGHVLVRADLGQIEPRVLAAISGDDGLQRAAEEADLYAPIAARLRVDRPVAKIAVLAAMYGQTSGAAGRALQGMEAAYPTAIGYLRSADQDGRAGIDVRTFGGRLVRMGPTDETAEADQQRSADAARGRYARNAMVQGAAAELFKMWAVTVRTRLTGIDARIVLCLHDELLVHARVEDGERVAALLEHCLQEAAHRWAGDRRVRFVADISIVARWSDAKA